MIIKYSKKLQRKNMILGIIFLVLGSVSAGIEPSNPVRYLALMYGIFLLAYHFFLKKTPYLELRGEILVARNVFRKTEINLPEVSRIKKFAGDVTLFTSETKLKINKDAIAEASKKDLDQLLRSLDAGAEEHPCTKISFNNS